MEQAGPQLLRRWIDRAATRDPDKAFIVAADDGRTLTYGQLRELTGRIATLSAGQRRRRQRPRCAALQQFDRASGGLFRRAGLWRDHLHRPCRDEPQPARQHPARAQAAHGAVRGRARARRRPQGRIGAVPAARRLGRPARRQLLRGGERLRAERCRRRCRPGRQRRHSVYLGHQRAAEGRGAELSRASVQRRADRRRLRPDGTGSHLRFPLVQLVLGADLERGAAAVPRRDPHSRAKILAQPVLRSHQAIRRDDRDRQSDHHRPAAQR